MCSRASTTLVLICCRCGVRFFFLTSAADYMCVLVCILLVAQSHEFGLGSHINWYSKRTNWMVVRVRVRVNVTKRIKYTRQTNLLHKLRLFSKGIYGFQESTVNRIWRRKGDLKYVWVQTSQLLVIPQMNWSYSRKVILDLKSWQQDHLYFSADVQVANLCPQCTDY